MKLYATKQDRWQERGRRDSALPLASQEDFLRKVVGGIQNPVFVKDESFRFVFVNEAFCRFMDRTESELLGRTDFDVVTAEHAQVFRDVEDRWIQARRIWNQHAYHVTNVREDGTIPQVEPRSWELLNTFRTNAQIEGGAICDPRPAG